MTAITRQSVRQRQPVIERASPSDRAFLAMDSGEVPEQLGVILMFDEGGGPDLARARRLIAERVTAVPRLGQRLVKVPLGCGGPIWVDDPGFDIRRHVRAVACREPGDEPALLETALSAIMRPLPRTAPQWSALLVTGPAGNTLALVIVLHHALADGVGGLAVLAELIDGPSHAPGARLPRPAPAPARLERDTFAARLGALRHATQSWHLLRTSMGAGGGLRPPRAAPTVWVPETLSRRLTWRLVLNDGRSLFSVWLREGHAVGHLQYSCNYDSPTSQFSGSSAGSPCSPVPIAPGTWRS